MDQEYTFVVHENRLDWLAPYIHGPCRLVGIPMPSPSRAKALLRDITPIRLLWRKLRPKTIQVPTSDGYVESQHFDAVHFPTQTAYLTELPSIYQPWDLQHLHYPQFFSKAEYDLREGYFRAYCASATYVCVQANWTKRDIVERYGISDDKVVVIPWGSTFDAYETLSAETMWDTSKKYRLPDQFFFYPAATWQHKNHEVILRALSILKSADGSAPDVYFTGLETEYRHTLDSLAQELDVSKQAHFLGFVTAAELQAIYGAATAMIFPSKFEGFGLPILEAFHSQLPVISSNATTLPEVARDAAVYFDPNSPAELAVLMKKILDSPLLRQDLARKGSLVLSNTSIEDTALRFQALYEKIALFSSQLRGMTSTMAARRLEL
jgi:glycosyltransferase involved in cell wall biosynthesis